LNEVGQAQLSNRPSIIPTIISIFTSERHLKVLLDKENAVIIGTAVDELIRHHPTLKQAVFEALKSTLSHIENIGMTYSTPKDLKQWYQLVPVSQERTNDDVAMQDATPSPDAVDTPAVVVDETGSQNGEESEDAEEKSHDNIIVSYIDILGRVGIGHLLLRAFTDERSSWKGSSNTPCIARILSLTQMASSRLEG